MTREKKAKIGATIALIFFIMMFVEPITLGSPFLLMTAFVVVMAFLLCLVWWLLYHAFIDLFGNDHTT